MSARIGGLAVALGIAAAIAVAAPARADSGDAGTRPAPKPAAVRKAAATGLKVSRGRQSHTAVRSGDTGAAELSGIAYAGGTSYYAVGDNGTDQIWRIDAPVNNRTGRLKSARVTGGITAAGLGRDSEGIALGPSGRNVWVSDEITSSISQFDLATGGKTGTVAVPSIYRPANVQNNMGLESLSYGAGVLWTANEEALKPDGALSTTTAGSWVRIQEFSGEGLQAGRQFGYLTDPIDRASPLVSQERSGLVDLLALPGGQVLALERELGGRVPRFRSRLYLLDFTAATDVSAIPSLIEGGFTPVTKTLLWQKYFRFNNFEGITLGPQLDATSYTLVLISDDGGGELGQRQAAHGLILRGVAT